MRKIALEKIDMLFGAISEKMSLYLPVDQNDGKAAYTKWEEGKNWSSALNTVKSPKDFFFPQTENLVEFKMSGKAIEIKPGTELVAGGTLFLAAPPAVRLEGPNGLWIEIHPDTLRRHFQEV